MTDVQKPNAPPGMMCPFHRRDVSKVCHKCEFWEALPMRTLQHGIPTGDVMAHWGCVFKHMVFISRDIGKAVDGVQGAINIANEQVWKETQKNLSALITLASKIESVPKINGDGRMKTIEQGDRDAPRDDQQG